MLRGAPIKEQEPTNKGTQSISNRKSKVDEGGVEISVKGKEASAKVTCHKMMSLLDVRSRHRYPLCSDGYPRKTHMVERGAILWGAMADRLGQHLHPKTWRCERLGWTPKREKCGMPKENVLVGHKLSK
jgi:hypothetical protein